MKRISVIALIISVISLCCAGVCIAMLTRKKAEPEKIKEVIIKEKPDDEAPEKETAGKDDSNQEKTEEEASENKTMQYVMYVGTNDKDTYKPEHTNEEAKDIVDQVCLKYFEGYTLQEATGSWTDEKNNITHEYTLVCYFDDTDEETVHKAADEVIKELNQNTVLIEKDEIEIDFYSGNNND